MILHRIAARAGASCLTGLTGIALLLALTACGGGGGDVGIGTGTGSGGGSGGGGAGDGGTPATPEAVVQSVTAASVREGNAGQTTVIEFDLSLSKAVVQGLDVFFSTASSGKAGVDSTGSARAGAVCGGGVDYLQVDNGRVSLAAGASSAKLRVTVCPDAEFEPHETLVLNWSSSGASGGSVPGTIVNDDAGGLNGTGAATGMGARAAFGRDVFPLTNDVADGALGFSFDKSQAGCVLDQVTGLRWQRAWSSDKTFAQLQAEVDVANQGGGLCGRTDWRVPTVNELLSLMDLSQTAGQALNADAMGTAADVMNGDFWSSEQVASASSNAWIVSFGNGGVSYLSKSPSGALPHVRLVSGGAFAQGNSRASVCNDASRYRDLGDGTVEDGKTGLLWKKCTEGASGAQCGSTLALTFASSTEIVARLDAVNAAPASLGLGYSDWRLPNAKELASLVDRCSSSNLAIAGSVFPNTQSSSYVSGSVDANNAQQFWYVDFSGGTIGVSAPSNKYLRLVRAGQ